jgi:hypothetical protein
MSANQEVDRLIQGLSQLPGGYSKASSMGQKNTRNGVILKERQQAIASILQHQHFFPLLIKRILEIGWRILFRTVHVSPFFARVSSERSVLCEVKSLP